MECQLKRGVKKAELKKGVNVPGSRNLGGNIKKNTKLARANAKVFKRGELMEKKEKVGRAV